MRRAFDALRLRSVATVLFALSFGYVDAILAFAPPVGGAASGA